ncbi:MAG: NBR1-Ig-like domain-containing protein [Anaerolineae bacterium]|jgi:hypothetical protein
MDERHKKSLIVVGTALLLVALACSPPGWLFPSPTPTAEQPVGEITPTIPPTEVSPSPEVTEVTTEAGCTLNAAFVTDVTVPDGTEFSPGASFTKVWRLRNTGSCPWEPGTQLAFISGDPIGGPGSVAVGGVATGSTTDISVNLAAPMTPGTYEGNWQLRAPDGTHFGPAVYVRIVVPEPITVTPTAEPCVPPAPALESILERAGDEGYDLGCPTTPAFTVSGAFQEFWANVSDPNPHTHFRSLMIWRSDEREIYVIDGQDTDASEGMLLAYTDFWEEGDDELHPDCAAMTPPSGYELPIRGFGKIWCENELWEQVGWPAQHEAGVTLLIQPTETGLLLKVSGPIPTGYLVALDYRAVWGLTAMTEP